MEFIFHYLFVPLLPSLNVDVCCSGAPRTMEAAPAIPAVATPMNCKSERIDATTRKGDLLKPSLQPSSTRPTIMRIAQQLLKGHGFQLQRSRPDQPLLLPEVGPRQRLVRQVPQALHEGRVALVKS